MAANRSSSLSAALQAQRAVHEAIRACPGDVFMQTLLCDIDKFMADFDKGKAEAVRSQAKLNCTLPSHSFFKAM